MDGDVQTSGCGEAFQRQASRIPNVISLSLSLYIYNTHMCMYVYVYMYYREISINKHMCVYIYIYIYIHIYCVDLKKANKHKTNMATDKFMCIET